MVVSYVGYLVSEKGSERGIGLLDLLLLAFGREEGLDWIGLAWLVYTQT